MASRAEIVRALLVEAKLVVMPGTREIPDDPQIFCHANESPDEIDNTVMIFSSAGMYFGRDQQTGQTMQHPGLKFNIRHRIQNTGGDLAEAVYSYLEAYRRGSIEVRGFTYYIQSIYPIGSLNSMGEEREKKRFLWAFDARIAFQDRAPLSTEE